MALLTPRQIDVLEEMAKGLTPVEIARELRISRQMVRKHIINILNQLEPDQ